MNTQSFERKLQQIEPPAPDPEARLRARHAAVAEFERLHGQNSRPAAGSRWQLPKLWMGGFATACVAIFGISMFWRTPEGERVLAPQRDLPVSAPASESDVLAQARSAAENVRTPDTAANQVPGTDVRRETPATSKVAVATGVVADVKAEPPPPQDEPAAVAELAKKIGGDPSGVGNNGEFFIGNTIADLRGMDPTFGTRTLTLVDGRRVVSSSNQADVVDLNIVPANLSERVDVVTGGASATYGSGAMAGTVNPQQLRAEQGGPAAAATPSAPRASAAPPATAAQAAGGGPGGGGGRTNSSDSENELSEVQATGTRMLMPNATSANPITTISQEQMQRLGTVNVADALTMLVPGNIATYVPALVGGDQRYVPTPVGGDRFEQFAVNPVKRTTDEPVSTLSVDVDTSSYSFVRRQLDSGALPPANAVRAEEMINYFDYNWPAAESREQPFKPTVTVSDSPWGTGRKLIHIGIKGYELPAKQRPDVNMVLLLDVSGSMDSPDKLPLAQRSMALLLDSLKPTDTIGIVVYAGAAGEVLSPTPVRNKDAILQALYSLRPGGSTAGAAGIQLAYQMAARNFRKEGVNRILLATDGDFNVGISDTNQLKHFVEQQREKGIFLSVLGFGQGNYRDDISQALAQNGNGVAAYIDSVNEARKVLVQQANSQLFTIAKDVKFQVEFNPATVAEYRLIGYETRALAREDFNNDRVDAGDVGAGHAVTAIYEITPVGSEGRAVDERRYGRDEKPAPAAAPASGMTDEYGYLKIRYKLPDSSTSQLITQPIAVKAGVARTLRQDVQFATAVAGFAQLLQGGRYTGSLSYDQVYREARDALGEDPYGYRAEFLQLVRKAQGATRQ